MNPRAFCEERDFPHALALTYSFDPAFFDRVPIQALRSGGSRNVVVLADSRETERAMAGLRGPVRYLGRSYLLAPVHVGGAFHPKLLLRLGPSGGLVAVSSGNLTHGGWGVNREVAAAWQVGPGLEDEGGWIPDLLRRARAWADSPLAEPLLARMAELPWLQDESNSSGRVIISGPETLGRVVSQRWAGRTFTELRFVTGSTDAAGQVIRWLHDTFGLERATGCITPSRCAWRPELLADIPVQLSLVAHTDSYAHAKAYHLSGPEGDVLLVGSANCSPAAWLRPPGAGGNVEMLLVYEDAGPEDLAFMDELLAEEARPYAEVLLPEAPILESDEPEHPDDEAPSLTAFQIEHDQSILARLANRPATGTAYRAIIGEERIPLTVEGDALVGPPPDTLPALTTAFGCVEVETQEGRRLRTSPRWLDDLAALGRSGAARALDTAINRLSSADPARTDEQVRKELVRVANALLTETTSIPDPLFGRRREQGDKPEDAVAPVDPSKLVRDLRSRRAEEWSAATGGRDGALGLTGVFRAIFGEVHAEVDSSDDEAEVSPEESDAEETNDEAERSRRPTEPEENADVDSGAGDAQRKKETETVEAKARARFERDMDAFMERLSGDEFRSSANAARLVQAVAFPYAAAEVGLERGWTDPERSRPWLVEAAHILLTPGAEERPSLLEAVRSRYEGERADQFERIVGDGLLWVTLTVGLVRARWPGPNAALDRMVLLRSVWQAEVLRAHATEERLERLIRRHRSGAGLDAVAEVAAPVADGMVTVEERMEPLILSGHLNPSSDHPVRAGELIWSPNKRNGWALALSDQTEKGRVDIYRARTREPVGMMLGVGQYASVARAAALDPAIAEAHDGLLKAFAQLLDA